jgi:hypothetical protein
MKNKEAQVKHEKEKKETKYVGENNQERDFPHEPLARKSYLEANTEAHSALNLCWVLLICWGFKIPF